MTQKKLWEDEIPNWLEILDRLEEVKKEDADNYFISDIENDFGELSLNDEAKKFSLYWSGKRKLKTNRKGSWKLGWRNWLNKALKQKENYGRFKEKSKFTITHFIFECINHFFSLSKSLHKFNSKLFKYRLFTLSCRKILCI